MWTSEASLLKSSWNNRNVMWTFSPGHATIIHSLNKVEWGFHAWPTSRLPCPWKFVAMHGAGANQSHPRVVLQLLRWSSRCRWCLNTADASIGPRFMKMFYGKFFMFGCFSVGSSCWLAHLFWSKTHSHAFVRNLPWFLRGLFVFNDCFSHLVRQWTRLGRFRTSKVTTGPPIWGVGSLQSLPGDFFDHMKFGAGFFILSCSPDTDTCWGFSWNCLGLVQYATNEEIHLTTSTFHQNCTVLSTCYTPRYFTGFWASNCHGRPVCIATSLIHSSHMHSTCWECWPFVCHRISQPTPTAMVGQNGMGLGEGILDDQNHKSNKCWSKICPQTGFDSTTFKGKSGQVRRLSTTTSQSPNWCSVGPLPFTKHNGSLQYPIEMSVCVRSMHSMLVE